MFLLASFVLVPPLFRIDSRKEQKKKNKNDLVTDLEQGRPEQGDQRVEEEGTTRVVSGSRGAQ